MFESAKTIINNYYTYIINNTTPATPPIGNIDTPATPEREPVVRTFLPVDLSANVKMDIEEAISDDDSGEGDEDEESIHQMEEDTDLDDTAFPMEVNPGDDEDEIAPYVTSFRGMRIATEEDVAEEEELMDLTEDDHRFRNVTMFRGGRGSSPVDDDMMYDNISSYRDTHPDSDEDDNDMEEDKVIYIDISDSIDENTISTMHYDPNARGTIRGCLGCHYFVASSCCTYSGIRCHTCDCPMDYVL